MKKLIKILCAVLGMAAVMVGISVRKETEMCKESKKIMISIAKWK